MEKSITRSLELLGLSQNESKFFMSSLELGPATIGQVAKKARMERSTAYLIADNLLSKNFLEQNLKGYRKKVIAIEPKQILRLVAFKQRQLRRQEIEIEENLPNLQALYSTSNVRPKVRVFEGRSGLLNVWEDILSTKGEILLWTNQETEPLFFEEEDHKKFIVQRVSRKVSIRVLAVANSKGKKLLPHDKESLRQTKLLPRNINFKSEIYIYDNKIAVLDCTTDIIGVIIENETMVNTQKAIFELTWKNL
jgi:HTH-type transcriptional regulator, sugar sensing transcriptional regulator